MPATSYKHTNFSHEDARCTIKENNLQSNYIFACIVMHHAQQKKKDIVY
jgi:hypothetical protein